MYITIETLKQMIAEPVSKEWFAKYGTQNSYPDAFISEQEQEVLSEQDLEHVQI